MSLSRQLQWARWLLAALAVGALMPRTLPAATLAGRRPNIIVILTDDQGYGDLSCHGHPVLRTPHIDRLHDEGVRFTDFHVSPTCSPTRAALLTGRHEFKNGVTHTILERERLAPDAVSLAETLRAAGYATGIFGKWHLGDEAPYHPDRRGFDEVFIHGAGGIGQTYPGSCGDAPGNTYFDPEILHNGRFVKTRGYCTDVFFAQALSWIEAVQGPNPFLAWIACNAPHAPLQVRPEDEARYAGRYTNANAAKFLGMVANIDDNVGRLLERLAARGLDGETLILFMNDNGTDGGVLAGYNAGMRGQKGTAFLGGTRAASFWRWPGRLQPADCHALAAHIDVFPTLAEIAGARLTPQVREQIEGRSLVPLLENPSAPWPDRTLFTHLGRWPQGADPAAFAYRTCSVRTPRWHLVSPNGDAQPRWLLFDVKADHAEQHDLASQHPDAVRELGARYETWWRSVQASFINEKARGPKVNPFKELYWKQRGGQASEEDLRLMDPARNPTTAPRPGSPRAGAPAGPVGEWVAVSGDRRGFVVQPWDRVFTPWGFNYDHDETGRLLEDYWEREWPRVESDFAEMRELGANVVRVHLQLGRFMEATNRPNPAALQRLAQLLDLAGRHGLRLDLTGLGCYHKADVPPWYDALTETGRWQTQARFWEAIASTCASNAAVFCYDLMNEPVVAGGPRAAGDWLGPPFAGKHFVQFVTLDAAGREPASIARDWIRMLVAAIRQHDRRTLITVGLVDWSLDRPGLRSGFVPERIAAELDFLSVHLYPRQGRVGDALEILRGFSVGKPVVIEETFPLQAPLPDFAAFMEGSRAVASGWLGFYWGRTAAELGASTGFADALMRQWLDYFTQHPQPVMTGHQTRRMEGWTVFVSDRLRETDPGGLEAALRLLSAQLRAVTNAIPARPLAALRAVPLWISPEYPGTEPRAEYHPNRQWLREHGRDPAMARAVEFTNARVLEKEVKRMPMLTLHELAHAYHDQVLGFKRADIEAAYRRARDSRRYDAVKRMFADGTSKVERAYAMTDVREYFAESTEAFFGRNDFFPFNRAELEQHDPDMARLLHQLWLAEPVQRTP